MIHHAQAKSSLVLAVVVLIGTACGVDDSNGETSVASSSSSVTDTTTSHVDLELAATEPWHRVVTFDGTRWDLEYAPGDGDADSPEEAAVLALTFTKANWRRVAAAPDDYWQARVDVTARLVGDVVLDADRNAFFQITVDPNLPDRPVVVWAEDCSRCSALAGRRLVRVRGQVMGEAVGTDAMGTPVTGVVVLGGRSTITAVP